MSAVGSSVCFLTISCCCYYSWLYIQLLAAVHYTCFAGTYKPGPVFSCPRRGSWRKRSRKRNRLTHSLIQQILVDWWLELTRNSHVRHNLWSSRKGIELFASSVNICLALFVLFEVLLLLLIKSARGLD